VNCPDYGVVTAHVPWADGLTGFTTMSAVARQRGLNRKTVAAIMQRAVARCLARRQAIDLPTLCVDETVQRVKGSKRPTAISASTSFT